MEKQSEKGSHDDNANRVTMQRERIDEEKNKAANRKIGGLNKWVGYHPA